MVTAELAMVETGGRDRALAAWPGSRRISPWTYVASAVFHPANLFVMFASVLLVARHASLATLAVGLAAEVAFLLVTARSTSFRRGVELALDEKEREAAQRMREGLLPQMGDAHRRQLLEIEALLTDSLAHAARRGSAVTLGARDRLAMDRLTLGYIHLAIEHRAAMQSLTMTDPHALQATVQSLEAVTAAGPTRPVLGRWLAIARRRGERWQETNAAVETLAYQLATIRELAYLIHQESLSTPSSALTEEIDGILADFEYGESAAREIAEMRVVDGRENEVERTLLTG